MPPEPRIPELIQQAFSSGLFQPAVKIWGQQLSAHLEHVLNREGPVLNWQQPEVAIQKATNILRDFSQDQSASEDTATLEDRFSTLIATILSSGQNLHHPHYIGHQVPAPVPLAALFDAVGTVTNQVMAVFEMGPWATAVEFSLLNRMAEKIGWRAGHFTGILTHGGSLANLTGLLTARNVTFPDCWERGIPANIVLVTNADAHYSVARAAGVLGIGSQQVIKVPVDDRRRMCPSGLNRTLQELKESGKHVMAVSACACATPTGAFDPLDAIADICEQQNIWLHVDAAHGGSALMSSRHRHLLSGIERADSVVWDAHKMMFVPALCAAVLYKNKSHRLETFRQSAPYLFDPSAPGMAEFDSGMGTLECTKRATGFGLWGLWSLFGDRIFEQMVDYTFQLGQELHSLLLDAEDFEAMHQPECNIVAFRYIPEAIRLWDSERQNQFQHQLRTRLIQSGSFYIVQTRLGHQVALRVAIMNPMTTLSDLKQLLDELRNQGRKILAN
ncbi:MAG: aminotransferase class I/II-fold pyridoxal phosphate-dependent enzyme [Planctomycetaceae bacterium]|nr:aminotransferase class I/II-fold pyridoxal phosphate-dependent enzyme [Planctomycetaceae bacterium]